jgi:hypothetical protein
MRLLTSTIVASARIFGTRIGNYAHVRSGNLHLRAKPIGTKTKKRIEYNTSKSALFFLIADSTQFVGPQPLC